MKAFQKSTEPQLNTSAASKILGNVFEQNQVEPNTIPLDVLESYSSYRHERFALQRTVLVIIMVLFFMLPFLFISPSFTLEVSSDTNGMNPVYQASLDTFMPVQRVTAEIDGRNIPVYETDTHVYSIEPTVNGEMKVTVTLINRQTVTHYVTVEHVDLDAPVVVSNGLDSENVYLYLSDSGSGIDYENIYAVGSGGEQIKPVSYDMETGCVTFAYPKEPLNVYVPDYADNILQLVLTIR